MLATAGGAQDSLLVEGAGTLAERLAAGLDGKVVYDSPVTALHRDDDGVTVHSATGVYRAARAIVTVPPPMAAGSSTGPHCPPVGSHCRTTPMGSVYKAIAIYDCPFWRERGDAEFISPDRAPDGGIRYLTSGRPGPPVSSSPGRKRAHRQTQRHRSAFHNSARTLPRLGTGVLEPRTGTRVVASGPSCRRRLRRAADHRTYGRPRAGLGRTHWPHPLGGSRNRGRTRRLHRGAIESGLRVAGEVAAALGGDAAPPDLMRR